MTRPMIDLIMSIVRHFKGGIEMVWTVTNLADKTGLTKRHINRLILDGKIKAERLTSGWIVNDEEAEKFIKEREEERKSASES